MYWRCSRWWWKAFWGCCCTAALAAWLEDGSACGGGFMDDWRLACFADHHVLMPDNGSAKRMECGCTDGRWAVGVGLCTFEACCFCVIVFAQMVLFLNTDVCPILPARCVRFGSWLPPSSIFFLCACVCVDRTYICVRRRFLPCCCIFRCRGTFFGWVWCSIFGAENVCVTLCMCIQCIQACWHYWIWFAAGLARLHGWMCVCHHDLLR